MKTLLIGINSKYIHPAMGVHQIYVNSKTDCSFREFTIKDNINNIINYINNQSFDILGFSVYIWNINIIKTIISHLSSDIKIILGGPEASYRPNDFLQFPNVLYIIKDEGEAAFNKLINNLDNNLSLDNVPNLYYRINNSFKFTFSQNPNIKSIKHDYSLIGDFKNRIVYLEASRGCCFKCAYCLASLEKSIRYFDFETVKEEILYVMNNGAKSIKFLDRSFNIKQEQMRNIIKFIQENDNNYSDFQFEIVGDMLDEETISLLKTVRKGLIRFEIGIQSMNRIVTRAVNRRQNIEILKENVLKIRDNIVLHLDLIAGLPYEDKESFIRTFNETFSLRPDELQLGFLKELQGTQISLTKDLHEYHFSNEPPYEVIFNKYISKEELDEIRLVEAGLEKFYNSSNFPRTISYLFDELKLNPYYTFLEIIKYIDIEILNKIQFDVLTKRLYESLINLNLNLDKEKLFSTIKQDYLLKTNIRPKIFWDTKITREERNEIYQSFNKKYPSLSLDLLYRYGHLEKYKNNYFLILYQPKKEIYFLN